MEIKTKFRRLIWSASVSVLSIIGSAGNALAASDDSSIWSGLNIRDNLDKFILKLDPSFQPAVTWVVDHVIIIAVVGTLLLLWWHSFSEKEARRSGSISGQAQHESMSEKIMKNFGMCIVYSVVILFFAVKCLL